MVAKYFFDSYAIYEIAAGNPNYEKYVDEEIRTSIVDIAEVYYHILKNNGESIADEKAIPLFSATLPIKSITIKRAMVFRYVNRKKKLSYADCIGYTLAQEHGLKFLTGDKEFKDLPNVEFVK
jgi:predicted nucleic acid-binding protein